MYIVDVHTVVTNNLFLSETIYDHFYNLCCFKYMYDPSEIGKTGDWTILTVYKNHTISMH